MADRHSFEIVGSELDLRVVSFRGREAISALFDFSVLASVPIADVEGLSGSSLEARARLTVRHGGLERCVEGIVTSVEAVGAHDDDRAVVSFALSPRAFVLDLRSTSRIFQDTTTRAILAEVLTRAAVPHEFRGGLEGTTRIYCVQYDETDLDFATRLCAEDGLFFWFEATDDGDVMVFGDRPGAYPRVQIGGPLVFRPRTPEQALVSDPLQVHRFSRRETLRPAAFLSRRYDLRKPSVDSRDESVISGARLDLPSSPRDKALVDASFTVYRHGGSREEAPLATASAARALEAIRSDAVLATGESSCPVLCPAYVFGLVEHQVASLDGEYVVTRVDHRGIEPAFAKEGESAYGVTFGCAPASTAIRLSPTPRRVRQTLETAMVVGPPGQEIHTDELGRVKVAFHWDLSGDTTDRASCWLRVVQGWGAGGFGAHFLPRVGTEVAVGFMDGDPDRPVVVGCMYNAVGAGHVALPAQRTQSGIRTRSSPGGVGSSELLFEDKAGEEFVALRSDRNIAVHARADLHVSAGGNELRETAGDRKDRVTRSRSVEVGGDDDERVVGSRRLQIHTDLIESVAGNMVNSVLGDRRSNTAGSVRVAVGASHEVVVGGQSPDAPPTFSTHSVIGAHTITARDGIRLESTGQILIRVGSSSVLLANDGLDIDVPAIRIRAREIVVDIEDGKTHMRLAQSLSLGTGAITLGTGSASLVLDSDAKLDGAFVKLNCGKTSAGGALERKSGEDGVATFEFVGDPALLASGKLVFSIRGPDGEIGDHPVGADGKVRIKGEPGDIFTLVTVKTGDSQVLIAEVAT